MSKSTAQSMAEALMLVAPLLGTDHESSVEAEVRRVLIVELQLEPQRSNELVDAFFKLARYV